MMTEELNNYEIQVLLVDDQAIVGEAVRRMLEPESDIRLHFCQDPARAIPVAVQTRPTVILQDLVMPGADGLSLIRYYRAHPALKDIPLIVLSSKEEAVTKADAFARGANDYLVKLPNPIELIARIRHHSRGYINLLQRNEAYAALLKSQEELASEVACAADYVKSLLPAKIFEGPVSADWRYLPSTQLGGDSFGYHWIDASHFAMYLLDVCGHGVGSALLSVSALNVLRSYSLPETDFRDPAEVFNGMNRSFQMQEHNNLYFTIWYGVYNTDSHVLRHAAAGHPPALLVRDNASWHKVLSSNMIIGALPNTTYQSGEIRIESGASLYLFSDGVYEVDDPGGKMWTFADLETFLASAPRGDKTELDSLYNTVQSMHKIPTLDDDFSIVRFDFF